MLLESKAAYSRDQAAFRCVCACGKHCRYIQVARAARAGSAAFRCRVCAGKGSSHEQLAYACLDAEALIEHYAVETYSLTSRERVTLCDGTALCIGDHRWDAMTLSPPNLLIEVHGEQHSTKLDTRARNPQASLAAKRDADSKLAAAAAAAGFSILWLHADAGMSEAALRARWAAKLQEAAAHVRGGGAPALFCA